MIIWALNAANGDASIIGHDEPSGVTSIGLVDGGPGPTFVASILPALRSLGVTPGSGLVDWAAVSHVDSDHIGGMLHLERSGIAVDTWLFNTPFAFPKVDVAVAGVPRGDEVPDQEALLGRLIAQAAVVGITASISQGQSLLDLIVQGGVHRLNAPENRRLLTGDKLSINGLHLTVVAPDESRIAALLEQWQRETRSTDPITASAARMDSSVTNLSSLVLLFEDDDSSALFTGDALEDDVMEGLRRLGKPLPMEVDVLKVPHHGSNSASNPTSIDTGQGLIENVIAKHYIVSGNGASQNPTMSTIERIVDVHVGGPGAGCTIWFPSPEPQVATSPTEDHYRDVVARTRQLADASGGRVQFRVGDGTAMRIDPQA